MPVSPQCQNHAAIPILVANAGIVHVNRHAMVTSSRRWRAVAMLIVVLAKPPPGERGFLFVANRGALSDARSKHEGDLRYALRSACATAPAAVPPFFCCWIMTSSMTQQGTPLA